MDFFTLSEKDFIDNNFFVENYEVLPHSLIRRLKVEYRKKKLFQQCYEHLNKVGFETNFNNAVSLIEFLSEEVFEEKHCPMNVRQYYDFLYFNK